MSESLRALPVRAGYGAGDVLVLFGELFGRGYANGIVDQARSAGMRVVGATVGRRDREGPLRPLTAEELREAQAQLGGTVVNVPLEAGFDLEPAGDGPSPVAQLKGARPEQWETFALDWDAVDRSRQAGARRFERSAEAFAAEIAPLVADAENVLFVHTMAGGFPRARVYMPLLARIFRGTGERYLPSRDFIACDLGKLWLASFEEVTARTFERLLAATAPLRGGGRRVRYVAYGYHGCEVLIGERYAWQTYVPYLQGWAKRLLEQVATEAWGRGVRCSVFNCPEIWTGSSALFLGVELALYPFLRAVRREGPGSRAAEEVWERCGATLKPGATPEGVLEAADRYLASGAAAAFGDPAAWPQHSGRDQLEAMLAASGEAMALSADSKRPMCLELSRPVVEAVGRLMLDGSWEPGAPVQWLNHDVIAKRLAVEP